MDEVTTADTTAPDPTATEPNVLSSALPPVLRVIKTEKRYSPADNGEIIVVDYEIVDGEEVFPRSNSYALTASENEIKADLAKVIATYTEDKLLAEKSKAQDAASANADGVMASLEGFTV